jgi:long-chain acyl-CoA synthetase
MTAPWTAAYEPGVPHHLSYPAVTLDYFLSEAARRFPYNTATNFVLRYVVGERLTIGGRLTYRQLDAAVERFAAALHALGVAKGDRVALMLPNSPHFVIAFFAAVRLGAIVVNINPIYTARELKEQLVDSGAETIVLLNMFYPRLREIQAETQVSRTIVATVSDTLRFPFGLLVDRSQRKEQDWVEPPSGPGIHRFGKLLRESAGRAPQVALAPDDVALFQYTGGTTGTPKAAMLTHRNLVANTLQLDAWFAKSRAGEEKFVSAVPFFHVYGMTVAMLLPIYLGAEMLIVPNPRPIDNLMKIIARERATIFPGVPAMYIAIVNHKDIGSYDLRSVRYCLSGSAPLPFEIQERFGELTGGRLVEGYGLTEAAPVTHGNPLFGVRKSGSIGVPLPDVEARLLDLESGETLPLGSERQGELLVRGPQVMKGYWGRPEETRETIDEHGWLRTGDICRSDETGYFYIVDRKKDMIIASGYKILPREVEEVLFTHPAVREAAVIGVPDPYRGETVKAFVVKKEGAALSAEELIAFCKENLAPYKVPKQVEFRDELPKTLVGKVLRRVLAEEERAKASAGGEPIPHA